MLKCLRALINHIEEHGELFRRDIFGTAAEIRNAESRKHAHAVGRVVTGGSRAEGGRNLENGVRTGAQRRLRTLQGRIDCGHAALHKVAAQEDHAVGGTGQCARISHLIEMPVVKRMIFSNNSNDLRKIYHTLSCILKKTAFRLVTRLSIGL